MNAFLYEIEIHGKHQDKITATVQINESTAVIYEAFFVGDDRWCISFLPDNDFIDIPSYTLYKLIVTYIKITSDLYSQGFLKKEAKLFFYTEKKKNAKSRYPLAIYLTDCLSSLSNFNFDISCANVGKGDFFVLKQL